MDKLLKISFLVFINYLWMSSIEAQICSSTLHFDDYMSHQFEKDIQGSVENPQWVKQQIMQARKSVISRSTTREIRVLIVYQNVTNTQKLPSLKKAEEILKSCLRDTAECKVSFTQVNQPFDYLFSSSKTCYKATTDLMKAASSEGWYQDADLVIGVTGEPMDDCGGYAYIGRCSNNIGRALITGLYGDYTNYIFIWIFVKFFY